MVVVKLMMMMISIRVWVVIGSSSSNGGCTHACMRAQIKAAILVTLGLLITKAGPGLKPFVPQLQTTFVKCLSDPAGGWAAPSFGSAC